MPVHPRREFSPWNEVSFMQFHPAPANDFRAFIDVYFGRCRAAVPGIRAVSGKWTLEDLIPGLRAPKLTLACVSFSAKDVMDAGVASGRL